MYPVFIIPGECSGSTTDFDSASIGSIPIPGAKFTAVVQWIGQHSSKV